MTAQGIDWEVRKASSLPPRGRLSCANRQCPVHGGNWNETSRGGSGLPGEPTKRLALTVVPTADSRQVEWRNDRVVPVGKA
eukprot:6473885-Amphidinium_carterae.1